MEKSPCSGVVFWCGALLLLLGRATPGRAQVYDKPTADFLSQHVDPHLAEATPDDHLLELSRAADVNFIADATELETTPSTLETTGTHSLYKFLTDLSDLHKLTWALPFQARIFLFWKQGEPVPLARRIVNGEDIRMADTVISDSKMEKLLGKYFKQAYGWDGNSADFSKQIPIADLPPEIRSKVVAKAQAFIMSHGLASAMKASLNDHYWAMARLYVYKNPSPHDPVTQMWVRSSLNGVGASQSIGVVDEPQQAPQQNAPQ